ncbi:unnamed protein product, partial [Staurois parvus]
QLPVLGSTFSRSDSVRKVQPRNRHLHFPVISVSLDTADHAGKRPSRERHRSLGSLIISALMIGAPAVPHTSSAHLCPAMHPPVPSSATHQCSVMHPPVPRSAPPVTCANPPVPTSATHLCPP